MNERTKDEEEPVYGRADYRDIEAVHIFKEMILDPAGIELFVENPASTLYPRVPLASQALFEELASQGIP